MEKKDLDIPTEVNLNDFDDAIEQYRRADVLNMLKGGVLSQIESDDLPRVYSRLAELRSFEILDYFSRQKSGIPSDLLQMDFSISQNRIFVCDAIEKNKKKFNFSDEGECEKLFVIACEAGSKYMARTLIRQNKAVSCYALIGSASAKVFELVSELPKTGIDNDSLVQLYFNAFLEKDSKDRIGYMFKHNIDIFLKNSAGKSAVDMLEERVGNFKYGGSKKGRYAKVQDEQTLNHIKKLYLKEDVKEKKKFTPKMIAVVICVCIVAAAAAGGALYVVLSGSDDTAAVDDDTDDTTDEDDETASDDTEYAYSTDTSLTVEDGDTVNIDYTGYIDDVAFDGGSTNGAGTDLTIGSGSYIDDFEEQLIGYNVGDTVTVTVTFPDDFGNDELNGKEAVFEVTINGIYED